MANAPQAACPGCGKSVDPLRAGHVAVLDERFVYFCRPECRRDYTQAAGLGAIEQAVTAPPPPAAARKAGDGRSDRVAADVVDANGAPDGGTARSSPPDGAAVVGAARRIRARREGSHAVVEAAGIAMGALAPALGLLGRSADPARLPLILFAWILLVIRVARAPRDPGDVHPAVVVVPTAAAVAAAAWAHVAEDGHVAGMTALAGLSCAAALAVERLVARARVRVQAARSHIERALDVSVRVLDGGGARTRAVVDVRPGELVEVRAGEIVGVDGVMTAGEARVVPWLEARAEITRRDGDPLVAGARVVSDGVRLTTTWSGHDRAWTKLLSNPARRIDVAAPTARALRLGIERGVPVAAALAALAAFVANASPLEALAVASAAAVAFGAKGLPAFVGLQFARAHLEALASGITYRDAASFERAGAADVAVLSARGTVLLGEPEVVAVEPVGGRSPSRADLSDPADEGRRVLALAAGAEAASSHPFALAIVHTARSRGVTPDPVRNATDRAGLGVTALASTGERLVVGRRALMLEEKIGVAVADARVSELEAEGRSVLLLALGDRVVGLLALQDGLRAGARAAVQKLLDARIEPVLLSGEARDTCETIGHALDIDHVRPEILPADRGAEVRALGEGGSVVAVIGHPATDDAALGAAAVAVAMGAAGATPGEWAVALASDDVRDAARALAVPKATRARVRVAIGVGAVPAVAALLLVGFGIAPLAVAPLATLLGAVALAVHAREGAPARG